MSGVYLKQSIDEECIQRHARILSLQGTLSLSLTLSHSLSSDLSDGPPHWRVRTVDGPPHWRVRTVDSVVTIRMFMLTFSPTGIPIRSVEV